jgi:predicted hotdog family 3-hydroxylacyl-ACP dehydratase
MNAEIHIPHRRGMLLIDELLFADDERAACELTVREGLFSEQAGVPAYVGIEYMAQAIAAWAGAGHARHGSTPRPGFLLGTRRYTSSVGLFPLGQKLRVEVQCELRGDNGLGMFTCKILDAQTEEVLAEARVSVFEQTEGNSADFMALLQKQS